MNAYDLDNKNLLYFSFFLILTGEWKESATVVCSVKQSASPKYVSRFEYKKRGPLSQEKNEFSRNKRVDIRDETEVVETH